MFCRRRVGHTERDGVVGIDDRLRGDEAQVVIFIGFEGKSGACDYVLIYETPYLNIAMAITGIGILVTLICLAYYSYKNRLEHVLDAVSWHVKLNDLTVNEDD